jgi:hypothetical protein
MDAASIIASLKENFASGQLELVATSLWDADEWSTTPAALIILSSICRDLALHWEGQPVSSHQGDRLKEIFLPLFQKVARTLSTSAAHETMSALNGLARAFRAYRV